MNKKPIAVLISDVHYNIKNLELADAATRLAVRYANELQLPLIVCGDLHDTKALLRGECVKALIDTFNEALHRPFILVGNHDMLNEHGEGHSLEFLAPFADIVKAPISYTLSGVRIYFLPYFSNPEACRLHLQSIPEESLVIMHQGLSKAWPGEYCHDHSAIHPEDVAHLRVISGHYHRAQNIQCGPEGKNQEGVLSYVGTPYTTSFAEANDGPKGLKILYTDGSLELVPTNLRKHTILDFTTDELSDPLRFHRPEDPLYYIKPKDLVWVKLSGTTLQLEDWNKDNLAYLIGLPSNYRLSKIPTDAPTPVIENIEKKSGMEVLEELINADTLPPEAADAIRSLARELMK